MNTDIININNQDILVYDFMYYLNEAINEWYDEHFEQETLEDFIKEEFIPIFNCICKFDNYNDLKYTEEIIKQISCFIKLYENQIASVEFHCFLLEDNEDF